jgi:hypothetical protein
MKVEEITLVKAWEGVALDTVADKDKAGKKYWKQIREKFWFMPEQSPRSLRSLQV